MASVTPLRAPSLDSSVVSLIDQKLSLEAFAQLSGNLAGYPFVKTVVERSFLDPSKGSRPRIHFLNHSSYAFHSDYIAETLLRIPPSDVDRNIDEYNRLFYMAPDRRFCLGVIALHGSGTERFFSLETVEIDTMDADMLRFFYRTVKESLDPSLPLLFKPASHHQETMVAKIDPSELPRVFSHELFSSARFVALNVGRTRGRIRAFRNEEEYRRALPTIEWYDIVVMDRVPDDIPRVSGIINAQHTTPLSHTNVLASGWQIPNAIQLEVLDRIAAEGLDKQWVEYVVEAQANEIRFVKIDRPPETYQRPGWSVQRIQLEEPQVVNVPIVPLDSLRMSDRYRYGTKAANLGELKYILENGSDRLVGFYRVKRPPRPHLLAYLAEAIGAPESLTPQELSRAASEFIRNNIQVPRGIAIPFSIQQEFLESSPHIQQSIGKLKMALELGAREIDSLCVSLQSLIRQARVPDKIRNYIDAQIADQLAGVSHFVVRSSSNAEDLENFSAAGIYESINHVTTADNIFQSIKEVWSSLLSPRSVRLRHEVGISLDDCYMGVIVQEEVHAEMGGVLVTTNPLNRKDFRNVYFNLSLRSVETVVKGAELPHQYLYNTVEGGGQTLALGGTGEDLSADQKRQLQILSYVGRLLQSHFSPDYTFETPVDIEWVVGAEGLVVLQLRPYQK